MKYTGDLSYKKHGDYRYQDRQPAIAGDKIIGDHGYKTFPGGIDDAAADDAGCVAAKSHAYGMRKLVNHILKYYSLLSTF